jgi:hypothetical protein
MKKFIILSSIVWYALSMNAQQTVFEKVIRPQTTDSVIAANCGVQSHDGGYMLAGAYQPSGVYAQEMLLIKTDSLGNELWRKFYGTVPNSDNVIRGIAQLPDSSYVCAAQGSFQEPAPGELAPVNSLIFRVDKNGNMMWHKEYDLGDHEHVYDLAVSDTYFIAVGYCQDMDKGLMNTSWIVSDFEGEDVHTYIESLNASIPNSVCVNSSGGYIIGAQDGNWPLYIELEQSGSILDTAYIGNTYPYPYNFKSQDHFQNNDTIYGCGYYDDGHNYPIIFNLDSEYDLMDSVILYNDFPHVAIGQKIAFSRDSQNFVIAGRYTSEVRGSELFIEKFSLSLESKWYHSIGSVEPDYVNDLIATKDGGYLIIGDTYGFTDLAGFPGIYLVKTDSLGNGNYTSDIEQNSMRSSNIRIYPNPASNYFHLKIPPNMEVNEIIIYDISGKVHFNRRIDSKNVQINISNLKPGMYIVTDNKTQFREKLLIY